MSAPTSQSGNQARAGTTAVSQLLVSASSARTGGVSLSGQAVSGNVYVFVANASGIKRVRFYLDNPTASGTPRQTENSAPWDFAGTSSTGAALPFNTASVADGTHVFTAVVELTSGAVETLSGTLAVRNAAPTTYALLVSTAPSRTASVSLTGQPASANVYVYVANASGIQRVRFYLDNPSATGTARKTENVAPWDFAGTGSTGEALPFDTRSVPNGVHTFTAAVDQTNGTTAIVSGTLTIQNGVTATPTLVASPSSLGFTASQGGTPQSLGIQVTSSAGSAVEVTAAESSAWLGVAPGVATTPFTLTVTVDPGSLAPGTYATSISLAAQGHSAATVSVTLAVGAASAGCAPISPLACSEVLAPYPYSLDFAASAGKVPDGVGAGTGFTMILPSTNGVGYVPGKLALEPAGGGALRIDTTAGIFQTTVDSQDNALGVGIDAPDHVSRLTTTLISPAAGSGKYEQAGLWFGNDEDNYVKLVLQSTPSGPQVQALFEQGGSTAASNNSATLTLGGANVTLSMVANPTTRTITGSYQLGGGAVVPIGSYVVPPEFFSFDAAGIDPTIGTRTFGGIFATHRNGTPLAYRFDAFSLTEDATSAPPPPPPTGGVSFTRTTYPVPNPTAMVWGPDDRLYVTELFGKIHALSFDSQKQVTADQVITTLGSRLTLGITVDPASTASDVRLLVSHSSPSTSNGELNSSTVTRLSGAGFATRQDVITGLPRAIANHAINGIHFGPDGRLYIAMGGNTGAGAPNTANTEFGTRAEQPLSAALLVADINAVGFDGTCATPEATYGPSPCDVRVFSSGLRNMYDFVFHSNGQIYGTDNGLGVTGTYPPTPTAPCTGYGNTTSWTQGGQNPGTQPDLLQRLQQGKYYGHPNPYRNECVFKNGSYQGVAALPNYVAPLLSLGNNKSADGIIEYTAGAFGGALRGELLIVNYSSGDDITRIKLSSDGTSVVSSGQLLSGFSDPLALAQGPDGTVYVAELGASRIAILVPTGGTTPSSGTWSTLAPMPAAVLDAGGAALGGKLYSVAGKTATSYLRTVNVFDPVTNAWTTAASLPTAYPAVENPAVAVHDGKLYAFGGSTSPFSGATTAAAVFDPSAGTWTMLPAMPVARGGATAQSFGGKLFVVGGMDDTGASLATVSVFDPTTGTWSTGPTMQTARDNPGSAVLNGKLYVFGGRTRLSSGVEVNGTLATVERLDTPTSAWGSAAAMPTGRRTMAVGIAGGKAQVMGGERTSTGGTFSANEEYDAATDTWRQLTPMTTGRHGAAFGTVNGVVYVAGGGTSGGSSFSTTNEAFTP